MFIKLKEIRALNAFAKKQSVGMQRKLMLYWVSMILVVFATIIFLLSIAGTFSQDDKQLNEIMKLYLENTQEHLENHLEILTAKSLNLSKELSRDIEIELAKEELGIETIQRDIDRTELYIADEAFYCGTGAQVSPITKIDNRPLGNGEVGPIAKKIQSLYFDVVRGKVEKYRKWCTPVK